MQFSFNLKHSFPKLNENNLADLGNILQKNSAILPYLITNYQTITKTI